MVDGGPTSDPSQEPAQQQDLPDRLRVHSLARALGTTSKRVVDALAALDGRVRSAHSGVEYEEAVRVRDLLSARPPEELVSAVSLATGATNESGSGQTSTERPAYMPLFVAPQPIAPVPVTSADDGADDDDADDDDGDDEDEEQVDRPANRRRRRGRRGRGRGRGEQNGSDGGEGDDDSDRRGLSSGSH